MNNGEEIETETAEEITVTDIAGRISRVKKTALKPSVWVQGNSVSTHI